MKLKSVLVPRFESDSGFRDVIERHVSFGMRLIGVLGIALAVVFTVAKLLSGSSLVFFPASGGVALFDKLVIVILCVGAILLAGVAWGGRFGRAYCGVCGIVIVCAMILDDAYVQDLSFTPGYVTLVLIALVATMPYRPLDSLLLVVASIASYYIILLIVPAVGGPPTRVIRGHFIFMAMLSVLLTGISAFLYRSRYGQYSARREVESLIERLQQQSQELRKLRDTRDRFFANISHEFRTPLTLILGPATDLIADGELDEESGRWMRNIERNAKRLLHLVNQLLDLSKLSSSRMTLHCRPRDVNRIVELVVSEFESAAAAKNLEVTVENHPHPVICDIDEIAFEKVVINLISNALTYTPEGGCIRVRVEADPSRQTSIIRVRDTGEGISGDDLPRIFDPFYQAARTDGRRTGTGIGLSLVAELVHLHQGEVTVESEVGFGSEFVVRIPLSSTEPTAGDTEEFSAPTGAALTFASTWHRNETVNGQDLDPAKPLVLVVDDNPDMREYMRERLRDWYSVAEACDGVEALDVLSSRRVDLVISDIMMPNIDGLELCRRMKSKDELEKIPIVLLTARADEESRLEGLRTGADDYMAKPFNKDELLARAENLIEIRRMLRRKETVELLEASPVDLPSADQVLFDRIKECIEEHIGNSQFGVDWLADEVAMSPRHLQRKVRQIAGISAAGLIRKLRLTRAAQLLVQRVGNVSEVALSVGYHDANYFSKLFKQLYGMPPSEYRSANPDLA